MTHEKRFVILLSVLIGLVLITLRGSAHGLAFPGEPPPTPSPAPTGPANLDDEDEILKAIQERISAESRNVLSYLVYNEKIDNLQISQDGDHAIAWILLADPQTGEVLPTEPGLVLANSDPLLGWQAWLPSDPQWVDQLVSAPNDLLTAELKETWLQLYEEQQGAADLGTFGGYLLPWEGGKTAWLSQSVAHDKYTPSGSAHYAFDFYIPQTMFNLYAAKSGTAWLAKWDVPNNNHDGVGNYLVLQDTSTNPTTYQLYLHLAQDSIPPALRIGGAQVVQGQFIGIADNTGQSTGHHLHFQVHTNPNSYWGTSVDITFGDVAINGGRPRVNNTYYSDLPYCQHNSVYDDVCEAFQSSYISGNKVRGDTNPPEGDLTTPKVGTTVNSNSVHIEGWAKDEDSGLDRVQVTANYAGTWLNIGNAFSSTSFSLDWDMCAANVPNGPVSLALRIWDREGNGASGLPGLVHFTKNYACSPPPTCNPTTDQIAVFANPNFGGDCEILSVGDYANSASFANLGDDNVESIKVGSNVLATLYSDASYQGRGETFISDDSNLADNSLGSNVLSSLRVRLRASPPDTPTRLVSPTSGSKYSPNASLSLSWRVPLAAIEFQARLNGPIDEELSPWLSEPVWHLDTLNLIPGVYTWQVKSRNSNNESNWSTTSTFTITSESPAVLPTITAPFLEDFEAGSEYWTPSGMWNLLDDADRSHANSRRSWYYGDADNDYKDSGPNTGDLTSPPILLPNPNENYALRFWYRTKTESPAGHWDQRWVQISKDDGPFQNVLQLFDDPIDYWLHPIIDLSDYAGSTIRIRFHFETLDGAFNAFEGWYIDDLEVAASAMDACGDADNNPSEAALISYGETKSQVICPAGDVDYYEFNAKAGERIVVDIDTPTNNPPPDLDLYLFLLDGDGTSVLAEHDDEVFGVRRDPHLGYLVDRSGTYYLKVRAWAHPSAGGSDYIYSIRLFKDNTPPTAKIDFPLSGSYLPDGQFTISASAGDTSSGISHVEFLWHSGNWNYENWNNLGSDWDGSDGWKSALDTSALPEQQDIAFYANVYDWAENWTGVGSWEIGLDRTPPVSSLNPLAATQTSNAVHLSWDGSDNLAGIDHFNLQSAKGGGAWQNYSPDPDGTDESAWFIGEAGNSYTFRLRAVDRAGNIEGFPTSPETGTSVPSAAVLCSAPDEWEDDNVPSNATPTSVGGPAQIHNFCNPKTAARSNDQDWFKFSVEAGKTIVITSIPLSSSVATVLELFDTDGTTLLTSAMPSLFGKTTRLIWTADGDDQVYLRTRHLDGRVIGNSVAYRLSIQDTDVYLPIITQ
jgi:murein DD-endopeptidase MepM/ murein hydrolase activator NlpD